MLILPAVAHAESMATREKRQRRTIWTDSHTLIFFNNHRWLARTKPGHKALRFARAELAWTQRELKETKALLRSRRVASARPAVDSCLSELISRESGWNVHATNPSSGAYGLPQALPGSKMASAGADWHDNPATQLRWMWGYVQAYGGSCGALAFQKAHGWY